MTDGRVKLRGMTWDHPRGYEPLAACARIWLERTGVTVDWERRSLQDFESFPVRDLAQRYDLIVIDHPHVGQVTAEGCLAALDTRDREPELRELAAASVGRSFDSYRMDGRQWALPIDAATQVQAWRPDRLGAPAKTWADVEVLARAGLVALPLRPPHSLLSLFSLCGLLGAPCDAEGEVLFGERAIEAYERLASLATSVGEGAFAQDPIAVLEMMASGEATAACAPLTYGYVSYSAGGFRPVRLAFADLPAFGPHGPRGSSLGGTGIAVSAYSAHRAQAADFAFWVASAQVQAGPYAAAGGQPGHAAAWGSDAVNAPVADFYRATRATLEGAWVRPRHNGYMDFQHAGSVRLNEALRRRAPARIAIDELNGLYLESRAA